MANYVITDGTRWIMKDRKGKYVPTSFITLADLYTKKQADAICNNSLSKALRGIFHVEKVNDVIPKQIKPVTEKDIDETEKVMVSENIQHWLNKVSDLNGLANEALNRKDELVQSLSNIDKELCDVLHYIEFCNLNAAQGYKAYKMIKERRIIRRNLNAAQGYKAYKMIKERRIIRRNIKNELNVLNIILSKKISETATDEINKCVAGMDKRTYEPRVLKELFDF